MNGRMELGIDRQIKILLTNQRSASDLHLCTRVQEAHKSSTRTGGLQVVHATKIAVLHV